MASRYHCQRHNNRTNTDNCAVERFNHKHKHTTGPGDRNNNDIRFNERGSGDQQYTVDYDHYYHRSASTGYLSPRDPSIVRRS